MHFLKTKEIPVLLLGGHDVRDKSLEHPLFRVRAWGSQHPHPLPWAIAGGGFDQRQHAACLLERPETKPQVVTGSKESGVTVSQGGNFPGAQSGTKPRWRVRSASPRPGYARKGQGRFLLRGGREPGSGLGSTCRKCQRTKP